MRRWGVVVVLLGLAGCSDQGQGESAASDTIPGRTTYQRFCVACHLTGVAGAPKTGDAEAWAPRIAKGREALIEATVEGVPPGMPPRGLCSTCDKNDLAAAVDYMIEQSQ